MDAGKLRYEQGSRAAALANGERLLVAKPAAAALQARALLAEDPADIAALRLLARALDKAGEPATARAARAEAMRHGANLPALRAAFAAINQGREEAVPGLLAKHLAADPDDPLAHLLLGEALGRLGDNAQAVAALERAIALAPGHEPAHFALARLHYERFDPAAALAALDPLMAAGSQPSGDILRLRAALLAEAGDAEAALALHKRIAGASPADGEAQLNLGDSLRTLGQPEAAAAAYRTALSARPPVARAWWSLASMGGQRIADAEVENLSQAAEAARGPDAAALHFAAARALDARQSHERAFRHYAAGNRLHRAGLTYDAAQFSARQQAIGVACDAGLLRERAGWGDPSAAPIFVLGMARSGSTLVEQIIGSHAEVEACGEIPAIPALWHETAARLDLHPITEAAAILTALSRADCAALGAEYLRRTAVRRRAGKPRFLDKLPHNWAELAFIRLILPQAQVIDSRRNPHDCALSNWTMLFAPGHPSSYDLGEWCDYFGAARAFLPRFGAITASLEALVDDQEGETRRLLDALGLRWDPACLDHARSTGAVATASAEQVRRPVNRDGIGTWRRFEPWLGEMLPRLDALKD